MFSKKLITVTGVLLGLFSPTTAYAASGSICPEGDFSPLCDLKLDNTGSIVGDVVTIMLIIATLLSLFFFIYGSIRWITSGGDKGKLESARGTLIASIVGLILAFLAYFILNILTYVFTGKAISDFTIPRLIP